MIRSTTPTYRVVLPFDVSEVDALLLTFAQRGKKILEKTASECNMNGNRVELQLSQEDTLKFSCNVPDVQIECKVKTKAGNVMAAHYKVPLKDCVNEAIL